jgi:cytochrome c-type biogenesis protein CcmH/NrfF
MTRRLARLAALVAIAATTLALATTAAAPAQEAKTDLKTIEEQVMCVVCRTPLSVAGGPQAAAQRDVINRLIAEGRTEDEIKDALVVEYGERVLALPDDEGFNIAVYVVPIVVIGAALLLLVLALPRWRRRARAYAAAHPTPAAGPELSADDTRRLDEDLRRYDG